MLVVPRYLPCWYGDSHPLDKRWSVKACQEPDCDAWLQVKSEHMTVCSTLNSWHKFLHIIILEARQYKTCRVMQQHSNSIMMAYSSCEMSQWALTQEMVGAWNWQRRKPTKKRQDSTEHSYKEKSLSKRIWTDSISKSGYIFQQLLANYIRAILRNERYCKECV